MYAFCAICSGVTLRFLSKNYQERPLNTFDWLSGTMVPFNVRLLLLKFGLMDTVALLLPAVMLIKI